MDRRNGGNPLAPPRPPKSMPRVHRPRAPEPDTVDSPSIHIISTHPPPIPIHHQPISRMNSDLSNTNNISSSINSSLSSNTTTSSHRSIPPIPPATAPLTPLQNSRITNLNNSSSASATSTFSRRRTDMPQPRIPAPSPLPSTVTRSLTPSSAIVVPATNFISNAISTVVGRSPSPVNNSVTLQIPRPENERLPNEYVDTPFTNQNNCKLTAPGSRHSLATTTVPNRNQFNSQTTNISTIDGISVLNNNNNKVILPNRTPTAQRPNLLPITKQPSFRNTNTLSKKDAALHQQFSHCPEDGISQNATNNGLNNLSSVCDQSNSITCPQCNRCRCNDCQRPRQLPSKWICDDNCFCSAETIIDYASCLCCVKALFYHCSKDHELDCESETIRCADDPCSCVPYKRASRWGCLSVLSILLPCLCCYWPMRGCVSLCAKCYAKHSRHGCRCNNNNTSNSSTNNSFNSRQNIINLVSPTSLDQPPTHHHHHNHRRTNNNDLTPEKRLLDSTNSEY